jgi:hypothetical protein
VLVLLSFALVLVATVLLVLGLLNDDGLTLIYISIASSVAAAVVLMLALRLNKPKAEQREARALPDPEPVPVGGGGLLGGRLRGRGLRRSRRPFGLGLLRGSLLRRLLLSAVSGVGFLLRRHGS